MALPYGGAPEPMLAGCVTVSLAIGCAVFPASGDDRDALKNELSRAVRFIMLIRLTHHATTPMLAG